MFDIGFPELLLVCILVLLVMGPERLPEVIHTFTTWRRRLSHRIAGVKQQIQDEIGLDQIRAQLHEESVLEEIKAVKIELNDVAKDASSGLDELTKPAQEAADPAHWPGMPPPNDKQ